MHGVTSSHECQEHDGTANQRTCIYHNILMQQGRAVLPVLRIRITHVDDLNPALRNAQTTQMPTAVFYFAPWAINYYHSFAETLVGMHIVACLRFGHCDASTMPGPRLFRIEVDWRDWDWSKSMPALQDMARCISPEGILHINNSKHYEQVVWIESAAMGIGPYNRAYGGQTGRKYFRKAYPQRPPAWLLQAFRDRISSCLGFSIADLSQKPHEKLYITIVQRGDDQGRHILNTRATVKRIWDAFKPDLQHVRIMRPEELSPKEVLHNMGNSHIVITTHGAALANFLFLPKHAAVIEYMWHKEMVPEHRWSLELLQDLQVPVSFLGLHTNETRLGEWRRESFIHQPKWQNLTKEQRLDFYEDKDLPAELLDDMHRRWHMNFNLDFKMLEPAIRQAINAIRSGVPVTNVHWIGNATESDGAHVPGVASSTRRLMMSS
ncbi:hypothetical protein WJX73_010033 [Symbiochloris irregularis]|uniref:Glycosyltransferase 61 catalytic domain-containing protein n=1 Tax=Symbiochloris irregularis TaxID=706552 RepID=A0AAW1NMG1_9CHLO